MNRCLAFALIVIVASMAADAKAQEIFGGKGVRAFGSEPAEYSSLKRSPSQRLLKQDDDFARPTNPIRDWWDKVKPSGDKPLFSMPKFPTPNTRGQADREGGPASFFRGLTQRPSWLPERDPTQPSMLEKFNQKTKAFADKTAGWFKGKSDNLTRRGDASWDNIKREMELIQQEEAQNNRSDRSSKIRPNIRSVRRGGGSGIR